MPVPILRHKQSEAAIHPGPSDRACGCIIAAALDVHSKKPEKRLKFLKNLLAEPRRRGLHRVYHYSDHPRHAYNVYGLAEARELVLETPADGERRFCNLANYNLSTDFVWLAVEMRQEARMHSTRSIHVLPLAPPDELRQRLQHQFQIGSYVIIKTTESSPRHAIPRSFDHYHLHRFILGVPHKYSDELVYYLKADYVPYVALLNDYEPIVYSHHRDSFPVLDIPEVVRKREAQDARIEYLKAKVKSDQQAYHNPWNMEPKLLDNLFEDKSKPAPPPQRPRKPTFNARLELRCQRVWDETKRAVKRARGRGEEVVEHLVLEAVEQQVSEEESVEDEEEMMRAFKRRKGNQSGAFACY